MKKVVLAVFLLVPLAAGLVAVAPSSVRADDDGLYGRFDGDLRLSLAVGAGARFPGSGTASAAPIGVVEARARYLDSAGVFVAGDTDDARWRVTVGVELRPLFLARFLLGRESGHAWLDLFVDSLGLELGVAATSLAQTPDAAFVLGTGIDVPLLLEPFRLAVRLAFRWTYAAHDGVPDTTDVTLLGALVVDLGVDAGIAKREGARSLRVP